MYEILKIYDVLLFLSIFWWNVHGKSDDEFPKGFKFGVATSAYQIEGGWNASDKGESVWDRLTHEHPEVIKDHSNGDVACDSYHLWETDVKNLKNLGVDYYRFSLSWTRILPTGFSNRISNDGVKYYNNLINSLLANGIEPMITIHQFDLPQTIQDLGGWTNMQTAEYFGDYARVVFGIFGDRVKNWITIREPSTTCELIYDGNAGAPLVRSFGIGDYLCGKTVLIAHANAYHIYDQEFRKKQQGKIGVGLDVTWCEPRTNETQDIEAAERLLQMNVGWFAHPIFSKDGDYPEVMIKRIEERSVKENFPRSRLPALTQAEIDKLKGSADFFGVNHYQTYLVSNREFPIGDPSFAGDGGAAGWRDPNWKPNLNTVPWGLYKTLKWIANEYNNPIVYIAENGYPDQGVLRDKGRIIFYSGFLKALLKALKEGCNVQQYTAWTLMDAMKWRAGYTVKQGFYKVDFDSPNRTRTPKASAGFYKDVIKTRKVPDNIDVYLKK